MSRSNPSTFRLQGVGHESPYAEKKLVGQADCHNCGVEGFAPIQRFWRGVVAEEHAPWRQPVRGGDRLRYLLVSEQFHQVGQVVRPRDLYGAIGKNRLQRLLDGLLEMEAR